jgi:hypothetical protein
MGKLEPNISEEHDGETWEAQWERKDFAILMDFLQRSLIDLTLRRKAEALKWWKGKGVKAHFRPDLKSHTLQCPAVRWRGTGFNWQSHGNRLVGPRCGVDVLWVRCNDMRCRTPKESREFWFLFFGLQGSHLNRFPFQEISGDYKVRKHHKCADFKTRISSRPSENFPSTCLKCPETDLDL